MLFWMGTAVPVPAAHHLFWWEAPRPVPLWVIRALKYLRFSAKAPGDITNSPLPGKKNNTRGPEKLLSIHNMKHWMVLNHGHLIWNANEAGWFDFCKLKASCFPWGVLQNKPQVLYSPGPRTQCHCQEKGKKERGTLYRTPLYLYLRNNNN